MKKFLLLVLIAFSLSSAGQELKINSMLSWLDKSRELFDKEFWKSVEFYESFTKPMAVLDNELLKYGFEFNNFDGEEGVYDKVDLRYLTQVTPRRTIMFSLERDQHNAISYSFQNATEMNKFKKELEDMGATFINIKRDTMRVPHMDYVSIDHRYNVKDKIVTLTESLFVMTGSAPGRPDYSVWIRYKYLSE